MKLLRQFPVRDQLDIVSLDIIDFNRLNGCFRNSAEAITTIFSWFNPHNFSGHKIATVTIIEVPDFFNAPQRDDWPGWEHSGRHVEVGRNYWNWFFLGQPKGELHLGDSPDFYGQLPNEHNFWGDIGKVSASTFAMVQKTLGANDLWISLLDEGKTQVIIETHLDLGRAYSGQIFRQTNGEAGELAPSTKPVQLQMPLL